jgi:GNAT superfamily N-acetyltransferase
MEMTRSMPFMNLDFILSVTRLTGAKGVAVGPGVADGAGVAVGLGVRVWVAGIGVADAASVEAGVTVAPVDTGKVQLETRLTHKRASKPSWLVFVRRDNVDIDCFQSSWNAAIITKCGRIIESMMQFSLLNADQTRPFFGQIIDIYQAAFSEAPYHETLPDFLNFAGRLSYHAKKDGFRCAVAWPDPAQPVVGFAYGYAGHPDSWFYDLVAARLPGPVRQEYLSDYFEYAEMALLPDYHNQGIGGRLHDTLLAGLTQQTACLSTAQIETRALHLYLKRGWKPLLTNIDLPGTILKYQVMGKKLQS